MVTIVVCVGSSCYVHGSEKLAEAFERLIQAHDLKIQVEVTGAFCMDRCSMGVSVRVGQKTFRSVLPENAETFFWEEIMPLVGAGVAQ